MTVLKYTVTNMSISTDRLPCKQGGVMDGMWGNSRSDIMMISDQFFSSRVSGLSTIIVLISKESAETEVNIYALDGVYPH